MKEKKVLIGTDTSHKDGSPHIMVTAIVCSDINARESKYNDVVGFYKYLPDNEELEESVINDMDDWADILKKNIICIIENKEKIDAWVFEYKKGEISYQEAQAFTLNDVNYDVWLDPESSFWNPVDFLLEGEYFYSPVENDNSAVDNKFELIIEKIEALSDGVLGLADTLKELKKTQP